MSSVPVVSSYNPSFFGRAGDAVDNAADAVINTIAAVPEKVAGKIVDAGIATGKFGVGVAVGAGAVVASDLASATYDIAKTALSVPVTVGCYVTGLSNFGAAYKTLVTHEKRKKGQMITGFTPVGGKPKNITNYSETEVESVRRYGKIERAVKATKHAGWGLTKFVPTMALAHGAACSIGPELGLMEPCTGMTIGTVTSAGYNVFASGVSTLNSYILQPAAEYVGDAIANNVQTSAVIAGVTVVGVSIYKDVKNWDSNASYFSQAKAGAYTAAKAVGGLALIKWGMGL